MRFGMATALFDLQEGGDQARRDCWRVLFFGVVVRCEGVEGRGSGLSV